MKAELWHAGSLSTVVEGTLAPKYEPIATSFLAVAAGDYDEYPYAYSEYGEIVEFGKSQSSVEVACRASKACLESARTNVPLVVVLRQSKKRPFASVVVELAIKETIQESKSQEVKRQVVLPRLLTLTERDSLQSMFGERDRSCSYYAAATEDMVGFSLEGRSKESIWCVGLVHSLARSSLGRQVSPQMDKGAKYV